MAPCDWLLKKVKYQLSTLFRQFNGEGSLSYLDSILPIYSPMLKYKSPKRKAFLKSITKSMNPKLL
jgi:hypothetical protein